MKKLILIPSILLISTLSFAGQVGGNGGDSWVMQFVDAARKVEVIIKNNPQLKLPLTAKQLENTINKTTVESVMEKLLLNGIAKVAINYPSKNKIVFNRNEWDLVLNPIIRMRFSLHEYLGIMNLDDSSYQISGKILPDGLKCNLEDSPSGESPVTAFANDYLKYFSLPPIMNGYTGGQSVTGDWFYIASGFCQNSDLSITHALLTIQCNPSTGKLQSTSAQTSKLLYAQSMNTYMPSCNK